MANSLLQSLNILGTQSAVSESTDYDYTTPEEALILNREKHNARRAELFGTIGPDPNYDEEGNIIPIMGYPPDISTTPFMSKRSLAAIGSKMKSFFSKSSGRQAAEYLSEKVSPSLIKKGFDPTESLGEPTKWSKLFEAANRRRLYNRLATKKEFEKFKKTYPEYAKGLKRKEFVPDDELYKWGEKAEREGSEFLGGGWIDVKDAPVTFKRYKDILRKKILTKGERTEVLTLTPEVAAKENLLGSYNPSIDMIYMSPSHKNISKWGGTLRHELKHALDNMISGGYARKDYVNLKEVFKKGLKPEIRKSLSDWNKHALHVFQKTGKTPKAPNELKQVEYLLQPTETLARRVEIATKGIGQSIHTKLFGDIKALKELKTIYTDDFIKELMKNYWGAAPVGLGIEAMDDKVYEDLNGKR